MQKASARDAVLVAPAHRVVFLQAAQAEEPAVYPFGGLPEHHVGHHRPHRRPELEAVAAESCAEVEAAALRHLINERVPIWGDCVQGGEPACPLAGNRLTSLSPASATNSKSTVSR